MGNVAIRVEGLGKKYQIGGPQQKYDRLGDQVLASLASPFKKATSVLRGRAHGASGLKETIWALKDVSFEIRHGEAVGIIGRNGAGKSTLLKILSQITEPSAGYADLHGRVGSLLEVGTGFHPELTGRENVFLNGAILGMSRREIQRKFDEIVDFAEIEQFIDTPVKHYSSGMYVRLAFSVAAHLEPEILLVDEVLAVGDVAFQRKCLGKMDDVTHEGRTVLFVSHNMALIQQLCSSGILLAKGGVEESGEISDVAGQYLASLEAISLLESISQRIDRRGQGKVRLTQIDIVTETEEGSTTVVRAGEAVRFTFHVDGLLKDLKCNFSIHDSMGYSIAGYQSGLAGARDVIESAHNNSLTCQVDSLLLMPGRYHVNVAIVGDNQLQDALQSAVVFQVEEGLIDGRPVTHDDGFRVMMPHRWLLPAR